MKEKVTFYLKEPKSKTESLVYAMMWFRNQRVKLSTELKVNPKNWNGRKYRVKPSATHAALLNQRLDRIAELLAETYLTLGNEGVPITPETLKGRYLAKMKPAEPEADGAVDVFECFERFRTDMTGKLQKGTLQVYDTVKGHLQAFERAYDVRVTFDRLDVFFFDKFFGFLTRVRGLNNTTAWKIVRTLRAFCRWAVEHEYTETREFAKFTQKKLPKGEKSEKVYLTPAELERVMSLDLSKEPRLDRSRDLYIFQLHTGLRYSDVAKFRREYVQGAGESFKLVTQKNKKAVNVPLLPPARAVLEKYEYVLPVISNQKQNEYIKEIMRRADITAPVVTVDYRGIERIEKIVPKCDLIGTHTAKRTFVTILRQRGVSVESIMRVTGNSRRTIETYILATEEDVAREIETAWT